MIRDLFTTILTGGTVLGLTTTVVPAVTVGSLLGDTERMDPLIRVYTRSILASAGVRHEAHGLENLPAGRCVLVCNHQSHFDPLVIFNHLPKHIRFVAKAELFKIPIFGQAMKAAGNIKVDRSGSEADRRVMEAAIRTVREKVSVLFFAEGTRSEDGVLRPFKRGAATLAIQAQVPIVPLAVAGTKDILPKGSAFVRGGRKAVLEVGEPILTAGKTLEDRDALTAEVRDAVARLLAAAEAQIVA